jgi:hypothetical protein
LPVHPAYLEARRILQLNAERTAAQSMVSLAKHPETPAENAEVASATPARTSVPLPPMRRAQQW